VLVILDMHGFSGVLCFLLQVVTCPYIVRLSCFLKVFLVIGAVTENHLKTINRSQHDNLPSEDGNTAGSRNVVYLIYFSLRLFAAVTNNNYKGNRKSVSPAFDGSRSSVLHPLTSHFTDFACITDANYKFYSWG
jgi:hypothetical protein